MDYLDQAVAFINSHAPAPVLLVVGLLGTLVIAGTAIIAITPTKNDDAWLAKLYDMPIIGLILKLVVAFSPLDKKPDGKMAISNGDEPKK